MVFISLKATSQIFLNSLKSVNKEIKKRGRMDLERGHGFDVKKKGREP